MNAEARPLLPGCLLFLVLWCLYVHGAAPTVTSGDAAELSAAALTLGAAHSPGYPLFVLLGRAFGRILPWGGPGYVMNLFSGFCVAGAAVLLGLAWKAGWPGAAALTLAGAAPLFRDLSGSTEVFGLNALMAAAAAAALFGPSEWTDSRRFLLASFLFGLGLTNQQTLLLIGPALFLWYLHRIGRAPGAARLALLAALLALAGLTLYGYLLIRSRRDPLLDWEDPETLSRFWKVVTRARYGMLQLAQGTPPARGLGLAGLYGKFFGETFLANATWAGALLVLPGLLLSLRPRGSWFLSLGEWGEPFFHLTAVLVAGPLFLLWASVTPSEGTRAMLERFLMLPVLLGFYFSVRGVQVLWSRRTVWTRAVVVACLALWAVRLAHPGEARAAPLRWNFVTRDHGLNVLRSLPDGATLFSDRADETEFSLAFLQYVGDERPDARFVDANAGVTTSLYGDDYYEIWGKPRLARRRRVEGEIIAAATRPVFYATLDTAQLDIPRRAAGILYEASLENTFTTRTRFPYWTVFLWRLPHAAWNARDRHLLVSDLGLMGDYALALAAPEAAARLFGPALRFGHTGIMSLANWLRANGSHGEAESLYRRLMVFPALAASAWNNLGVLHADRAEWDKALESYRRSLEVEPGNAMAHYNIGVVHWQRKDWAAAEEAFRAVARLQPDHPAAAGLAAEASRRRGRR